MKAFMRVMVWGVWVFACVYALVVWSGMPDTMVYHFGALVLVIVETLGTVALIHTFVPDKEDAR